MIEGLDEVRAVINAEENYRDALIKAYESGAEVWPESPKGSVFEIRKKYPRAAAYIEAELLAESVDAVKASIGRRAKERIINGEDFVKVLIDREEEWIAAAKGRL